MKNPVALATAAVVSTGSGVAMFQWAIGKQMPSVAVDTFTALTGTVLFIFVFLGFRSRPDQIKKNLGQKPKKKRRR